MAEPSDEYTSVNRRLWDARARVHFDSAFYDVEGFRRGGTHLLDVELDEIGSVAGRDLLHLQCHFGLDTLSFARLGARVTGVDFSEVAVEQARALAGGLGLLAEFICADVLDLPAALSGRFDIVYTSRGVLCWLGDLEPWAAGIARCLRPGGRFYIFEDHPVAAALDEVTPALGIAYPYFERPGPDRCEVEGSYADRAMPSTEPFAYEWSHGLGEVLTALIRAGLRVETVREFPFAFWRRWELLEERAPGEWWLPSATRGELPLSFSITARRP